MPEEHEVLVEYCQIDVKDSDFYLTFTDELGEKAAWREGDFDVNRSLSEKDGPFLEVAGPTDNYRLVEPDVIKDKLITSNIEPGLPTWDPMTGEFLGNSGTVDVVADSRSLPVGDSSLNALFGSNMLSETREQTVNEAKRVLKEGGLLVVQGFREGDIAKASEIGFSIRQYQVEEVGSSIQFDVVMQKTDDSNDGSRALRQIQEISKLHVNSPARLVASWKRDILLAARGGLDWDAVRIPNFDSETGKRLTDDHKDAFVRLGAKIISRIYNR